MLVHHSWYDNIEFHFLMPGHSHYCVDRDCFSCIGKCKWKANCHTPSEFWETFLPSCFTSDDVARPSRLLIDGVWDWKSFFCNHLNDISGHSHVRSFKFVRDPNTSKVVMYYKSDMLQPQWKGFHDDFGFQLLNTIPDGVPQLIPPVPLPQSEFIDLAHFQQHLSPEAWQEWQLLQQKQFPESAFQTTYDDFWLQHPEILVESDDEMDLIVVEPEVPSSPIQIPRHPIVTSDQLLIGSFLAYKSNKTDYVIGCVQTCELNTCKVFICTLDQDSLTVELTEELCTITFDSIILSNFTLTKKGKLRKPTLKQIHKKL